jgi:hypothetical protein
MALSRLESRAQLNTAAAVHDADTPRPAGVQVRSLSVLRVCALDRSNSAESIAFSVLDTPMFPLP